MSEFVSNTTNSTNATAAGAKYDNNLIGIPWNFLAAFKVFTSICTFALNASACGLLITKTTRHTSFNTYLINLLICNILYLILMEYYDVIVWMKPNWWDGTVVCDVYLYANGITPTCMAYAQVLITCNRIVAVTFPQYYRLHHSSHVAVIICIVMWIIVHMISLPLNVLHALWYRLSGEDNGCMWNLSASVVVAYAQALDVVTFAFPVSIITGAYPYLLWKTTKWRRSRPIEFHRFEASDNHGIRAFRKENYTAFLVLTMLTITVFVCWVPSLIMYLAADFGGFTFPDEFYQYAHWMVETEVALDAIMLFVSVKDLRDVITNLFRWQKSCQTQGARRSAEANTPATMNTASRSH